MSDTRVFFVTDSLEDNEELFETYEEAQDHTAQMTTGTGRRIRVCIVLNSYKEGSGWNYDDHPDTFETVKVLEEESDKSNHIE